MAGEVKYVVEKPNLAVGLLAFFGLILCLGLRAGWWLTFHWWFQALAKVLDVSISIPHITTLHPFGFLADAIVKLDNTMAALWGKGISVTGHAFAQFALWVAYQVTMIGVAIAAIGYELLVHGARLITRTSVTYIRPLVKKVTHVTEVTVTKIAHAPAYSVTKLRGEVRTLETKVDHLADSVALPAPLTIPRVIPKVGDLTTAEKWAREKLRKIAGLGTVAGIIGLVGATIFDQFGLGWLRCKGVGRVGRSLCGLSSVIESLAADAITAFAVSDLCRFANGITTVAEGIRPAMLEWVDVKNALFHCSRADYPKPLPSLLSSATPVIDPVAL